MTQESILREILERLNKLDKIDDLALAVTAQSTKLDLFIPRLEKVEGAMNGNGKTGILGRLIRIEVILGLIGVVLVAVIIPLANVWATLKQSVMVQHVQAAQADTQGAKK